MMKSATFRAGILLASIFLLLAPLAAHSQTVTWGPVAKAPRGEIATNIISSSPTRSFISRAYTHPSLLADAQNNRIERINSQLASEQRSHIIPAIGKRNLIVRFVLSIQGQLYAFASLRDQQADITTLYAQKVNSESLTLEGDLIEIGKLQFKGGRTGSWGYTYSRDSSHVMIYSNSDLRKNEPEKYNLYVFSGDLELEWSREVTLPYEESRFNVTSFALDGDGNAFVLGILGGYKGINRRIGLPNHSYRILAYYNDGEQQEEYEVTAGSLFLTDMTIDVSPKKDIICAGFYSEQGTWSVKGSYYLRIDRRSKEVEKVSLKEFDLDFITMHYRKRVEERARKRAAAGKSIELYEYDLRDLIPRADGGAVLLAEQYFIRVVCTRNSNGTTTCTTYYYYDDIIVVSIGPDGEIEWANKIPKRQISTNDFGYYSSYATMITDDALYLIYNDHLFNHSRDLPQGKFYNFTLRDKNGIVAIARIDHQGNVTRKPLISNAEISAITIPKLCRQVNRKQLLLYAKVGKKYQYGFVSF